MKKWIREKIKEGGRGKGDRERRLNSDNKPSRTDLHSKVCPMYKCKQKGH